MTIAFGSTKADQTGTRISNTKRLYANPFTPEVCVILDLAVYIWCKHCACTEDATFLFDGKRKGTITCLFKLWKTK